MGSSDKLVIPGECIFPSKENLRPGQGTYELHGRIYASLTGYVFMKDELKGDKLVQVVEVRRSEEQKDHVIPYIDGIVTARVLNIGQRFAKCELLCVEDTPLTSEYSAILRKEDIRSTERDKAEIAKCYQPGDIILARVLSFGDNISSFLLTTAEDQLGVVSSISTNEERLVPCDWESVKGVKTGITESRKVAQVPVLNRF